MGFEGAGNERRGTLVLFPGALGDAVCLEPTIAYLARAGRVVLYARGAAAEVARLFPDRPEVRSLDAPEVARLFAPAPSAGDAGWLDGYARIASFTGAGDAALCARLGATGRAVVAPFPRAGAEVHASHYFLRRATGDPSLEATEPRLVSPCGGHAAETAREAAKRAPLLVIHPGASTRARRAPTDLLCAIGERWRRAVGGEVALLLGPAEVDEAAAWADVAELRLSPDDVADLAGAIAAAAAYVGNDSGPSHVAAGLGVMGAVLYTTTAPGRFGPRSARLSAVLLGTGERAEAIERTWEAVAGSTLGGKAS